MKKNIAMRVAAFLFILTMISTCAFATTFAKYTTDGDITDTAKVAKWGVTIKDQNYDNKEYEFNTSVEDTAIIVDADVKTLAPGSKVNFACLVLGGTPEVAVEVNYTATLTLTGWTDGTNPYCPLIFKVGTEDFYIGKTGITNQAELITAVQNAIITGYSKEYAAGTDLSAVASNNLTVSCSWDFEGTANGQNNLSDTALGDAAANGTMPTVSLYIKCEVDQLNDYTPAH